MTDAGTGAGASPLIVGPDMSPKPDFSEFIDYDDDDALNATSPFSHLATDLAPKTFSPQLLHNHKAPPTTLGAVDLGAAESPDSLNDSFRDSSSDSGSSKRTGSSAMTAGDISMVDGPDDTKKDWPPTFVNGATDDGTFMFGSTMDESFSVADDSHFFDFGSASSSPEALTNGGTLTTESPAMPTFPTNGARTSITPSKSKPHLSSKQVNATSHFPLTQPMNGLHMSGSREVSPLSQEIASHQASPSAMFHNSPPPQPNAMDFNSAIFAAINSYWGPSMDNNVHTGNQMVGPQLTPQIMQQMANVYSTIPRVMPFRCQLFIQPTPMKSRVETQIPIRMTLVGAPLSIKRLHLPTHTISKPKLLAKPPVERSPDMLELYTQLVCSSAMQDEEKKARALERAATASHPPIVTIDEENSENPNDKPQNGGDVRICSGCITRERKRASRKKIKKVEEEELWKQDESRRVIVFNTGEVKEWQTASTPNLSNASEPGVPLGTMHVDAPMRIACYCRHHSEKVGFRVIFTIKDFQDRVVAQAMSQSIMITDDHKTHPGIPPTLNTPATQEGDNSMIPAANGTMESSPLSTANAFGTSQSSTDLQNAQRTQSSLSNKAQTASAAPSTASLSRPVSPSSNMGPASKKRKASGSRVPIEMTMTRLDASPPLGVQSIPPSQASVSTATSPFTPNLHSFNSSDAMFSQGGTAASIPPTFNNGATTPNRDSGLFSNANRSASMDNMTMTMFSAPTSAHPSRAPSPNTLRQGLGGVPPSSLAQGLVNGMSFLPATPGAAAPQPIIHKIIPGEGPKMGGIEVTILGSGFTEGLVVYFGEHKATTTTFWGEQSLVCLLPPASRPGIVPVSLKQAQAQSQPFTPGPSQVFRYLDDEESQLTKMMLGMISQKMTGHILDVRDLAARIMNTPDMDWSNLANTSGSGNGFGSNNYTASTESQLLKCLELIDLDDSARMPRLDLRRSATGQSMLHLGCSLGYHRFVAGLIARGANPDLRDRGGFTPMHMAALNDHEAIVRRLMQAGADPTIRSLSGLRPADLSRSRKVVEHIRRCERHIRSRSGGSLHSKASSAASLRSLWDPLTSSAESDPASDGEESPEYSSGDFEDDSDDAEDAWLDMRRSSSHPQNPGAAERRTSLVHERGDHPVQPESPTTALAAVVRDQVAAQLHQFQQAMQMHLPNFGQMPNLPQMPTFPRMALPLNYQAYLEQSHIMDRMSSLMPTMSSSRPGSSNEQHPKTENGKWWDFSSLLNKDSVPPPSYSELFPRDGQAFDKKQASAAQAAAEAVADAKCSKLFDSETQDAEVVEEIDETSNTTPAEPKALKIGRKTAITREQQQDFLRAHAEKFKGMRSDKNLWFIWIPLLTLILAAMLYNRFPQVFVMIWSILRSTLVGQTAPAAGMPEAGRVQERLVEVL